MSFLPAMNYTLLVPLTPPQLETRRLLLNQAGYLAWLSPAIILLPIAHYTFSSPPKPASKAPPTALLKLHRRLSWLLNTSLSSEFGSVKIHLLGLAYACWLLFLIFRGTGNDYASIPVN